MLRRLPERIVSLRMRIFTRVNGGEGVQIPGPLVGVEDFRRIYSHPAANGRSRGAALSDLFWYWLSPGPEIHQEHLEPGERYAEISRTTRAILSMPAPRVQELASRYAAEAPYRPRVRLRLRDVMMPIWAGFFYEVVFGRQCPAEARALIVANADDVVTALKCCGLRHMKRRHRLTRYLEEHLDEVAHPLPEGLSQHEQALYLQGTFFNTAVVQASEAMTHLLMVMAHHPEMQAKLAAVPGDARLLDHVMNETMRLYPLFGIAHRITSDDIVVDEDTTLPAGSVLCFNYPGFHREGYDDPDAFDPDRWSRLSPKTANFIPFGMPGNRPCPAWHLTPIAMRTVTEEVLSRFTLCSSAQHTRSIPNRGPCLLIPRASNEKPRRLAARLRTMRVRDRWEDVWRSLVQLVLGTYMVWDARRQRLCRRHFESGQSGRSGRYG
ncbi:cytochrome P450 [Actinomadura barringtoniae]|uniref:Cytochrome P450 n=1 Tax=Actinomadura barringtoniae TaxID=1427535 RepID=A0A939PJ49_9ACTN|nr:cytochrome P450 [Actinomadura barringtoniae]MBO2453686.1 cytochrome P450 [Actinomadura barringtoniae]